MADFTSISTWRNMFTRHGSKMGWGLVILFGLPMILAFGLNGYQKDRNPAAQNTNADDTVMKVNDVAISRGSLNSAIGKATRGGLQPGLQMAQAESGAIEQMVGQVVIQQLAEHRNVHADDADLDKQMAQMREEAVGKDASDSEWRSKLAQATGGKSLSEVRQEAARSPQMLAPALVRSYESEVKVTDQDARNQHAKVQFRSVLISAKTDKAPMMASKVKPLSDADAKKKAEDLLAKAKGGADVAALAKANSADFFAAKGGDSGLLEEYRPPSQMSASMGSFYNGKDFDEAIHKTANGAYTDVIKATGFVSGYVFAKVIDRKVDLPKDFDAAKEIKTLKEQKAREKLTADYKKNMEAAKVVVLDPDLKAYYDYGKLQQDRQKMMSGQSDGPTPTKEQIDAAEKNVLAEFDAFNKRSPKDATVALVLAEFLKNQQYDPKLPQPQRDAIRDRLQSLYEAALVSTEDSNAREALAAIYRAKNMNDKAVEQYTMQSKILDASGFTDAQAARTAQQTHMKLATEFTSVGKPDLAEKEKQAAAAAAGQAANLQAQAAMEQQRQAEAAKAAKAAEDAAKKGAKATPGAPGPSLTPSGATPGSPIQVTPVTPGGGTTPPISVTPQGK